MPSPSCRIAIPVGVSLALSATPPLALQLAMFAASAMRPAAAAGRIAAEATPVKPGYVPLGEFTVNLPPSDGAQAYALLDLTLEAVPGAAQTLHDILPRLKESALRQLMAMAERGDLKPGRVDPATLKTALLEAIGKTAPGAVREVLITKLIFG
jgi:flagellar basal body-associated protein FliL